MGGSAAASVPQLCHRCQPGFQGSDGAAHAAAGSGHASSWALHAAHLAGMERKEKTTLFGINSMITHLVTYRTAQIWQVCLFSCPLDKERKKLKGNFYTSMQSVWGCHGSPKGLYLLAVGSCLISSARICSCQAVHKCCQCTDCFLVFILQEIVLYTTKLSEYAAGGGGNGDRPCKPLLRRSAVSAAGQQHSVAGGRAARSCS